MNEKAMKELHECAKLFLTTIQKTLGSDKDIVVAFAVGDKTTGGHASAITISPNISAAGLALLFLKLNGRAYRLMDNGDRPSIT